MKLIRFSTQKFTSDGNHKLTSNKGNKKLITHRLLHLRYHTAYTTLQSQLEQLQYQPLRPETPNCQYPIHYDQDLHNSTTVQLEQKPYDPNLVCPMCGKRHRIGEIQEFRKHVSECDADDYMYT